MNLLARRPREFCEWDSLNLWVRVQDGCVFNPGDEEVGEDEIYVSSNIFCLPWCYLRTTREKIYLSLYSNGFTCQQWIVYLFHFIYGYRTKYIIIVTLSLDFHSHVYFQWVLNCDWPLITFFMEIIENAINSYSYMQLVLCVSVLVIKKLGKKRFILINQTHTYLFKLLENKSPCFHSRLLQL